MLDPTARDLARHAERVAARDALFSPPRPPPASSPLVLPATPLRPRRAWLQADYSRAPGLPGAHLGTVPWEEMVAACGGSEREAERWAQRGGMRWDEMAARLGREPRGWRIA